MEYTFELFELSEFEISPECEIDTENSDLIPYLVGHKTQNNNCRELNID